METESEADLECVDGAGNHSGLKNTHSTCSGSPHMNHPIIPPSVVERPSDDHTEEATNNKSISASRPSKMRGKHCHDEGSDSSSFPSKKQIMHCSEDSHDDDNMKYSGPAPAAAAALKNDNITKKSSSKTSKSKTSKSSNKRKHPVTKQDSDNKLSAPSKMKSPPEDEAIASSANTKKSKRKKPKKKRNSSSEGKVRGGYFDEYNIPPQTVAARLKTLPPEDQARFKAANSNRLKDDREMLTAHTHLLQMRSEHTSIQNKVTKAQEEYDKVRSIMEEHCEEDAETLLEPKNEWNDQYRELKALLERGDYEGNYETEGENGTDSENNHKKKGGEDKIEEWICTQRDLRHRGELAHYKVVLLNRLNFDWSTKTAATMRSEQEDDKIDSGDGNEFQESTNQSKESASDAKEEADAHDTAAAADSTLETSLPQATQDNEVSFQATNTPGTPSAALNANIPTTEATVPSVNEIAVLEVGGTAVANNTDVLDQASLNNIDSLGNNVLQNQQQGNTSLQGMAALANNILTNVDQAYLAGLLAAYNGTLLSNNNHAVNNSQPLLHGNNGAMTATTSSPQQLLGNNQQWLNNLLQQQQQGLVQIPPAQGISSNAISSILHLDQLTVEQLQVLLRLLQQQPQLTLEQLLGTNNVGILANNIQQQQPVPILANNIQQQQPVPALIQSILLQQHVFNIHPTPLAASSSSQIASLQQQAMMDAYNTLMASLSAPQAPSGNNSNVNIPPDLLGALSNQSNPNIPALMGNAAITTTTTSAPPQDNSNNIVSSLLESICNQFLSTNNTNSSATGEAPTVSNDATCPPQQPLG